MRILIAIDKFKGSIPATVAAQAIASVLKKSIPGVECDLCPIADGGEGTAEAVITALRGDWCETATFDAQNNDTLDYFWSSGDTTQIVYKNVAGQYTVRLLERKFKCERTDTVRLFVNDTVIAIAGSDQVICHQKSATIQGQHKPYNQTATYQWKNITQSTTLGANFEYVVSPKNTNPNGGSAQNFNY
jgi:hypothetical protein